MTDIAPSPVTNDMTDESALEVLFQPPFEVRENEQWTAAFHATIRSLQRDASGLPLDSAQRQLIERIATVYVRWKWAEATGSLSENQRDMLHKQYLGMLTQFQRVLLASEEVLRQDLIAKFSKIFVGIPEIIQDDDTRKKVRSFIREQTAALGF